MATRAQRLAEFNGDGDPPPNEPVQVLCEDKSGTYQLPFFGTLRNAGNIWTDIGGIDQQPLLRPVADVDVRPATSTTKQTTSPRRTSTRSSRSSRPSLERSQLLANF